MIDEQKVLVQESFKQVEPIADKAAFMFYDRLFELDPTLRPLFKPDMTAQRQALMTMLRTAIIGLDHLDTLVPAVEALGRRHAGYGVQPAHYATVGTALLDTLGTGLGDGFTPEVREAWTEVYGLLAGIMQDAAAQSQPAAH